MSVDGGQEDRKVRRISHASIRRYLHALRFVSRAHNDPHQPSLQRSIDVVVVRDVSSSLSLEQYEVVFGKFDGDRLSDLLQGVDARPLELEHSGDCGLDHLARDTSYALRARPAQRTQHHRLRQRTQNSAISSAIQH
jgi:hypothetical protein